MNKRKEQRLAELWRAYQTGQGSVDHTARDVFFEVVGEAIARDDTRSLYLSTLAAEIRAVNNDNGWNVVNYEDWAKDPYKIPAILALIHSEVSEALEEFRKQDLGAFIEELADVQIRLLDLVGGFPFDFEHYVEKKIQKNRQRPFRHGNKRI